MIERNHTRRAARTEAAPRAPAAATWVDPASGLEWQCESPGEMTWPEAVAYAVALKLAGRADWRLPAVAELESLLDRTRYRPVVREGVPFGDTRSYWSSTTFGPDRGSAWIVMFDGAYVLSYYKTNVYHVRCVRGCDRLHSKEEHRWPSCL